VAGLCYYQGGINKINECRHCPQEVEYLMGT
jgi:hypothetical protein